MPKVPAGQVVDPFNTKTKDKDQSRLPQGYWAKPSTTELLMAAAIMHEQGRLFEPDPILSTPESP